MIATFWDWTSGYRTRYAAGLVLLVATNAVAVTIPWLVRGAIDGLEAGQRLSSIAGFGSAIAGLALLQAVIRTFSRLQILGTSRRIVYDIRRRFFECLLRLDAPYYDRHSTGDIMSRGINDVRLLRSFYGPGVMNLLNTAIVYIASLAILVRISPSLTLVALLPFPLVFFIVSRISRRIYARSLSVQEQLAEISERARENFAGIGQVKTFAQESREAASFGENCAEYRRRALSMAALRGLMLSLIGVIAGIGILAVLAYGGYLVIEARITLGDFVAFNAYLGMLTWPTIAMGWIVNVFHRGASAMERLQEVLGARPQIAPPPLDAPSPGDASIEPLSGSIEIRDLTFAYERTGVADADGRAALRNVSVTIPEGQRVGVVGAVGSGKTTFVNLIARMYPIPPETIFIGGEDIADVPVERLRASLGYVPQESFLFSRSLRENVAFGAEDAGAERVEEAARLAQLEQDIASLSGGLDAVVGERGITLSGGQRQRASLARAAIVRPRLLILDDALSAVDSDTEARILSGLAQLMEDRTAIFISHRISSLVDMDRLIVLDEGRIVEDGSHRELLARGGTYARLFHQQELERRLGGS